MKASYLILVLFYSTFVFTQQQNKVDFITADIEITPNYELKKIEGYVTYTFKVLQNVDSVFFDAKNINLFRVKLDGKKKNFKNNDSKIWIKHKFKKGKTHSLILYYEAFPKQSVYFVGTSNNPQIWTQGQGKYTSHWLPSFDDMEEKVIFNMSIKYALPYDVISNGKFQQIKTNKSGLNTWVYKMDKPMSSYLLAFVIGSYAKQFTFSENGIPLINYYYPTDSSKVEPTYRHNEFILNFLEEEIGVDYPWQNYKQIPVKDFLYAGMENTGTTVFSDAYVIDSTAFIDKNYVNVQAHELAHQWFGDLVTEKNSQHHWLHEGFATYYAYLTEKELFGDAYFYWKLYDTAVQLNEKSLKNRGKALTDPKASSLTFYEKGAWALVVLRDLVGDTVFKKGVVNYLKKYQFKNATVDDFLNEVEILYGKPLQNFKNQWLYSVHLADEQVFKYLKSNSAEINMFLAFQNEVKIDIDKLNTVLVNDTISSFFKEKCVASFFDKIEKPTKLDILKNGKLKVKQALVAASAKITLDEKPFYVNMLSDKSYVTQEMVLFKLWQSFSTDRSLFLNLTKKNIGLPDKNVRQLWLILAVLTENFEPENTQVYYNELSEYTGTNFNWETRLRAFQYLNEIGFDDNSLTNLLLATEHHSWQFKKFARLYFDKLLKDEDYKNRMEIIFKKLNNPDLRYISTKFNK